MCGFKKIFLFFVLTHLSPDAFSQAPTSCSQNLKRIGYTKFHEKIDHVGNEFLLYLMPPPAVALRFLARSVKNRSFYTALKETARKDKKYIFTYAAFIAAWQTLSSETFYISLEEFQTKTDELVKPAPQDRTLFINGIDKTDPVYPYTLDFLKNYQSKHPNTTAIYAISYSDLLSQLTNLEKSEPFQHIEIFAHGSPGTLSIGEDLISSKDLANYPHLPRLAAKGATLRFISCSLATNTPTDKTGEKFMNEMAQQFFQDNGTVVGSTKTIVASSQSLKAKIINDLLGLGVLARIEPTVSHIWRDYSDLKDGIRVLEIN